jgi:hypothetical protein
MMLGIRIQQLLFQTPKVLQVQSLLMVLVKLEEAPVMTRQEPEIQTTCALGAPQDFR